MSTSAARRPRPLSPFMLGPYYRPQLTSMLSITHRATGVVLAFGAIALALWLVALARGNNAYVAVMECARGPLGRLILVALAGSLAFHFANGIRHLFWDAGRGFELKSAYASGYAVMVVTLVATLAMGWYLFLGGAVT